MEEAGNIAQVQEKGLNFFSRFFGIFFEPRKVFLSLDKKPVWIDVLIVLLLLLVLTLYFFQPLILQEQKAKILKNEKLSEEQKSLAVQSIDQPFTKIMIWVGGVLGFLIVFFIVAGIFFLIANFILGGEGSYKRMLSIYAHSSLVMVPASIVKLPLALVKKTMMVQTSPAAFLSPEAEGSVLYVLFSSLDIFTIWTLILISLGVSVLYKFSFKKAGVMVFIPWLLYVVIKVVASSLFKGSLMF